jgi:stearoyl-CoA desaturase (delta-9 desaturase)
MKHARLVQLLALVNTIIAIVGSYYFPEYILHGIIAWAFVNIFSSNIAIHRFMSHKSFKTTPIKEKILKYLTVISAFGSPLSWTAMHRYHHMYSGSEKDNEAPQNIGYIRAWLTLYEPVVIPKRMVSDIIKDKDYMFITRHYWKLLFGYAGILYVIDPLLGVFAFSFPAACIYQAAGAFAVIPHSKYFGYIVTKPNKDCTAVNSPLTSLISWGEGWHNYHHTISKDYRHGHKWWEVDPPAWFIEKLFLEKR